MTRSKAAVANSFNVTTIRLLLELESIAKSNTVVADEIYTQRRRFATLVGSNAEMPISAAHEHILEYADNVLDNQAQFEQYVLSFDPTSVSPTADEYPLMGEMLSAVRTLYPVTPIVKRELVYDMVLDLINYSAEWAKLD